MKRFEWIMAALAAGLVAAAAETTNTPPAAPVFAVTLKQQLASWVLPNVAFRDSEPATVVEYLRTESKKFTADQSAVNFVWMVPPDTKLPHVTMQLRNVSFEDVLRYTSRAAGLRYRIEEHAVVISQREPQAAPPPPSPPSPKPDAKSK